MFNVIKHNIYIMPNKCPYTFMNIIIYSFSIKRNINVLKNIMKFKSFNIL